MSIRRSLIVASLLLLSLAACSSNDTNSGASGSTGAGSPAESATPPASGGSGSGETEVQSEDSALGTILTDADGSTLYVFMNDTGSSSTCTGSCASTWPAFVANGEVKAGGGGGVDASLLGTTKRDDGTMQVTYNGHPLYHFSGDQAAGDTNGQGIGGIWFVVSPAGDPIKA